MKRIFVALCFIFLMLDCNESAAISFHPARAPVGFRGIPWGYEEAALSGLNWQFQNRQNRVKMYHRQGEVPMYGRAKIEEVLYLFEEGRFYGVKILANGENNRKLLLAALRQRFGPEAPFRLFDTDVWLWSFPDANVSLVYWRATRDITIDISSRR